jgi:hypothetical protein
MTEVGKDILRLTIYSDIFRYPLKSLEIYQRLKYNGMSTDEFRQELTELVNSGFIHEIEGYYLIDDRIDLVKRRMDANNKTSDLMPKALKNARLISAFPFVRAVFLSGSLSKGDADNKADIDYFIITSTDRLWIARTLLTLYKKIVLFNSYKYFCLNYFIDQSNYRIDDRNLFTATELISLLPLFSSHEFQQFNNANQWVRIYYPHFPLASNEITMNHKAGNFKMMVEALFNNRLGNIIDNYLMKFTTNVLNRKIRKLGKSSAEEAFNEIKFEKHCCKYHRNSFQKRILNSYKMKIHEFEIKHNFSLSS